MFERTHGVKTALDHDEALRRRLPSAVESVLYRIAQEALNNVFKHAHATQARVVLRREEGILSLCIADDGRGFDLEATAGERMGLNIMRERTDFINADLVIDTDPGEGTEVRVTWLHPDIR